MSETYEILPVEKLHPAPDNPRRDVGDVTELAASIAAVGILEPLIVTPDGSGGHLIVAGARRFAAAKKAGLPEVPCIVREMTDEERILAMAIENLQRVDLLPLEEAAAFSALAGAGWSQRRIAKEVGRSQAHVSKRMALLALPEPARAAVDSGVIGVADAQELLKLKDMPTRLEAAVGRIRQGHAVEWAVRNELDEHRRAERLGKLIEKAKSSGLRYVETVKAGYGSEGLPRGAKVLRQEGHRYDVLDIIPEKHAGQPCHAITVLNRLSSYQDAELVYICTKPANHPQARQSGYSAGGPLTESEKKKRRAKIEHGRARRAAQAIRDEFVEGLFKRKPSLQEATQLLILSWRDHDHGAAEAAIRRVGLQRKGATYYQHQEVFAPYLEASPKDAARLGFALAVEAFEKPLRTDYPNFDGAKPYFAFLERHGYTTTEAEKLELARKAPR